MKKVMIFCLSAVLFLQGCSFGQVDQNLVEWGEYNASQEERLKKNGIPFEVKNDMIYIEESDLDEAVACCS